MINSRSCYVVVLAAFWRLLWTSAVAEDLRLNSTYQPASKAFPRLDSSVLLSLLAGASISYFPGSGTGRGGTTHASQVLQHDYDSFPPRHVWLPQSAADISLLGFDAGAEAFTKPAGWSSIRQQWNSVWRATGHILPMGTLDPCTGKEVTQR